MILIIIIAIIVIISAMLIGMYNGLVRLNIKTQEAWSDITVQLKRRADLIPNLVNTVKGYAAHESGVFDAVTKARASVVTAADSGPAAAAKAEGELTGALKSLFAVAENYPDLKASQNFQDLQTQLTDTEDKIMASRRFYNGAARDLNIKIDTFPSNVIAGMFGFKKREFFEVEDMAAIDKPTEVQF